MTEDEIGESRRGLREKERWKCERKERNKGKAWSQKREGERMTAIKNERDAVTRETSSQSGGKSGDGEKEGWRTKQ